MKKILGTVIRGCVLAGWEQYDLHDSPSLSCRTRILQLESRIHVHASLAPKSNDYYDNMAWHITSHIRQENDSVVWAPKKPLYASSILPSHFFIRDRLIISLHIYIPPIVTTLVLDESKITHFPLLTTF